MSNEEIRQEILNQQAEIQKLLTENSTTFELNPKIAEHKKNIDKLRAKCTHLDTNHEVRVFNGRCLYCGKKM